MLLPQALSILAEFRDIFLFTLNRLSNLVLSHALFLPTYLQFLAAVGSSLALAVSFPACLYFHDTGFLYSLNIALRAESKNEKTILFNMKNFQLLSCFGCVSACRHAN
jgi:hypothetical protein